MYGISRKPADRKTTRTRKNREHRWVEHTRASLRSIYYVCQQGIIMYSGVVIKINDGQSSIDSTPSGVLHVLWNVWTGRHLSLVSPTHDPHPAACGGQRNYFAVRHRGRYSRPRVERRQRRAGFPPRDIASKTYPATCTAAAIDACCAPPPYSAPTACGTPLVFAGRS